MPPSPAPSASPSALAISWVLSTVSGYGIYGLQIVLQFLRRNGHQLNPTIVLTHEPSQTIVSPLIQAKLDPVFALSRKLHTALGQNPEQNLMFKHAALHSCGSNFSIFPGQDRIWGEPNIACAAIEHLNTTEHGLQVAKNYDIFIAISKWNEAYLKNINAGPVYLCHQGIDGSLFYPARRSGLYADRFVIFSGGKFEFRKGQDIVLIAFKIFREKHPEALLVTAWQNLNTPEPEAFQSAGHVADAPAVIPRQGLGIGDWLLKQGLPPGSFINLFFTPNYLMPGVLRDCDVAIFPNRCEGGTNLVAMEAMACGVPTYVSYNTGQRDLVDLIGCDHFGHQKAVIQPPSIQSVEDWGETDIDSVVAALETVYTRREAAQNKASAIAARMAAWEWGPLNEKLLRIACDGRTE